MNFELSDDQRMVKDSITRLVVDQYGFDQRLKYMQEPKGWSQDIWTSFVDLGLTMLPFSEAVGGLGLGGVETMIVGEAFGKGLVIEPYLSSIVMAGSAIEFGAGEASEDILVDIIAGKKIAALADLADTKISNFGLSGTASVVLGGDQADLLIIPFADQAYLIPSTASGVTIRGYRLHGGGGAADVMFENVNVSGLTFLAKGSVTKGIESGISFLAAEASGAMRAAFEDTVEYLKIREQFGKPIGKNQALQHRAAEMLVEVEQAESAAIYAALLTREQDPIERARGMAAVKAVIGKTGRFVAQSAVQLHGGIGVSEEHMISHYFRRLTAIGMLLGGTKNHLQKLADLGGFTGKTR